MEKKFQECDGDQANCSRGAEEQGSRGDLSSSSPLLRSPSPLLIRPLLCIAREGVEAYCRERGLEFRTDETNRSLLYTRNRIRNEVLPALSIINPRVVESIARAAEHLADDQDALNCMALSLLEAARVDSSAELHPADGSAAAYSVPALLEQPAGMQRRMIIEALRRARTAGTPGAHAAAGETISAHARAIEALFEPKASGKHITLPGGLEVWREFDLVVFKAKTLALETPPYQYSISATCPNVEAGGFLFTLRRGLPGQSLESVIEENRRKKERSGKDWIIVALDDQALPERLIIRPRRRGERAHVVGQRKTIKLKNLMIDHRIPSSRRANWPIVAIPDGCYVWSPGLPPSLDFAARDEAHGLATMRASAI